MGRGGRGGGRGSQDRGRGTGQGRGGGRMGGPLAAGPGGICVCPSCGRRETHQVGTPCNQTECPACGTLMVRE